MATIYSFGSIVIALTSFVHFALQIVATLNLRKAKHRIGGAIKSQSDLDEVRVAIQTDMYIGIILICNGLVMITAIVFANAQTWGYCLGFLSVVVVLTVTGRIEKQFKTLSVEPGLEDLGIQYQAYVKQWTGCHVFLKAVEKGHERDPV